MPITPGCQPSPARTSTGRAARLSRRIKAWACFRTSLFQGLALPVEIVEIPGLNPGLGQVVAEQQFQGAPGLAHPAGGIEPGRQLEDHVLVGNGFAFQLGDFLQGDDPGAAALLQDLEPLAHQDAVFPHQRHHVGGGAQGHQVQVGPEVGLPVLPEPAFGPEIGPHPQGQEQGHPHPGQLAEGVSWPTRLGLTTARASGSSGGISWWSVMITSRPWALAQATSAASLMPQSTVTTSLGLGRQLFRASILRP